MSWKYLRIGVLLLMLGLVPACGDDITNLIGKTDVALLTNLDYVDFNPSSTDSEASNLAQAFAWFRLDVEAFTDTSATGFTQAGANARIMVIPELEGDDLAADLSPQAAQAIAGYVQAGGSLFVFLTNGGPLGVDLINGIFGFSLAQTVVTGPYALNATGAAGTSFEGGPASVVENNATESVDDATLPAGSQVIYHQAASGDAVVAVIPVGSGEVIIFGYDWFNGAPKGTQDGGWLSVLYRATQY